MCSPWIWLDGVDYQAGSVAEGRGGLVYKAKAKARQARLRHVSHTS